MRQELKVKQLEPLSVTTEPATAEEKAQMREADIVVCREQVERWSVALRNAEARLKLWQRLLEATRSGG